MRRIAVALALVLGIGVVAPAAGAQPQNIYWLSCLAYTATARQCYQGPMTIEGGNGGRIDLRAKVYPAHAGEQAHLFRSLSTGRHWVRVATLTIAPTGRTHFLWRTTVSDILPGRHSYYRFQFRLPGHARGSNVFQVRVIDTDV